jgi:hypothetical protein
VSRQDAAAAMADLQAELAAALCRSTRELTAQKTADMTAAQRGRWTRQVLSMMKILDKSERRRVASSTQVSQPESQSQSEPPKSPRETSLPRMEDATLSSFAPRTIRKGARSASIGFTMIPVSALANAAGSEKVGAPRFAPRAMRLTLTGQNQTSRSARPPNQILPSSLIPHPSSLIKAQPTAGAVAIHRGSIP